MLLKGSRGAAGRGPVWRRAGSVCEGRASQQSPPRRLDGGGARAAASGEAGRRTSAKLPRGRQPPLVSSQLPARARKPIGQMAAGRRGEGRKSGHVTRKRLCCGVGGRACVFLPVPPGHSSRGCPGSFSGAGGWGSAAPLADPVVQAKDGPHCKEPTSSSSDSPGPQRVGRGGVTVGADGGRKDGSAATLGKTSQRFRGARVCRVAPPFQCTAPALASPDTSRPKLCKRRSAGLASPSSAADWRSCGPLSAAKAQTALSPPDPASFSRSRPSPSPDRVPV